MLTPAGSTPPVEIKRQEDEQRLSLLSVDTLAYMYDYGLATEQRLRHHRSNLSFVADQEFDLLEAMRLNSRLNRVSVNIDRAGRRNERLRAELVRRELSGS
jgi:hypothetical protein